MSPHAIFWWAFALALVVVLAMTGAQALRAARELQRFDRRLADLGDLPILKKLARAETDAQRIQTALAGVAPLVVRAEAAIAVIRRGPLPPELVRAFVRIGTELAAFRAFSARYR